MDEMTLGVGCCVVTGLDGGGKTILLDELFRCEMDSNGEFRNVLYIKAPSRTKTLGLTYVLCKEQEPTERHLSMMRSLLRNAQEHSASSEELPTLLLEMMEKGVLGEGSLVLLDELEAGLHPASQKRMVETLVTMAKELHWTMVVTTKSLLVVRYFEKMDSECLFLHISDGELENLSDRSELLYQELSLGMEDL